MTAWRGEIFGGLRRDRDNSSENWKEADIVRRRKRFEGRGKVS